MTRSSLADEIARAAVVHAIHDRLEWWQSSHAVYATRWYQQRSNWMQLVFYARGYLAARQEAGHE